MKNWNKWNLIDLKEEVQWINWRKLCWAGVWTCKVATSDRLECIITIDVELENLMKDFSNRLARRLISQSGIKFFMKFPRNTLNKIFGAMKTCLVGVRLAVPWGHEWRSRCWLLYCVCGLWVSPFAGNSIGKCEGIWIKLSLISHWDFRQKSKKGLRQVLNFLPHRMSHFSNDLN